MLGSLRQGRLRYGKDLQKGKDLSLEWKSEGWWNTNNKKGKGSPYLITERRVAELISVLGSQPAGGMSHKPGGRLPLLSTRPTVTLATLKRATTSFAAWWTEARWVWTVYLRLLPDSVTTAIWVQHANHSATEPLILITISINVSSIMTI